MSRRKSMQNDKPAAGAVPGSPPAGQVDGAGATQGQPGPVVPWVFYEDDELVRLYAARVATIDRYRIPITDKGLVSAYRKAFDEAALALEVYHEKNQEKSSHE